MFIMVLGKYSFQVFNFVVYRIKGVGMEVNIYRKFGIVVEELVGY